MKHVRISNHIIRIESIELIDLYAKDREGKDCISIDYVSGKTWLYYGPLEKYRNILRNIPELSKPISLLDQVKRIVRKPRLGRESIVSKEIKELLR